MKKIILLLLVLIQFNPVNAQKDDTASQIAGAIAGAIVGAAAVQIAVNQYEEQVELIATNYILDNYPEWQALSIGDEDRRSIFINHKHVSCYPIA